MAKSEAATDTVKQASEVQEDTRTLSVDGQVYDLGKLSDQARQLVVNVQAAEHELRELNRKTAIANTAHVTYMNALREVLPEPMQADKPASTENKPAEKKTAAKKKK